MNQLTRIILSMVVLVTPLAVAEEVSMRWGLENTWSYRETLRGEHEDGTYHPEQRGKEYRAFAFNNSQEVLRPMFECLDRHFELWDRFKRESSENGEPARLDKDAFQRFKSEQDPTCVQHAKQQAPSLYFDFVATTTEELILESIEIATIRFSEYKGGGFFEREAWYDVLLSHQTGTKRYDVSRRLVFTGHGRCELRFWSDNFYETQGWITPMGEYMLDIKFIFSAGEREISVSTGIFKIDV